MERFVLLITMRNWAAVSWKLQRATFVEFILVRQISKSIAMNTDFVIDAAHWQAPLPRRRHDVLQMHLTCTEKLRDHDVVSVKQWRFEHLLTKQQYSTYVNTPVLHKLNQSALYYSRSMYNRLLSTGNETLFPRHQWCSAVLYACNDVQIRCSCTN